MIHLDFNAGWPVLSQANRAMQPFLEDVFGNPASAHAAGRKAKKALEDAREQIADLLGAHADEVIFTSGATEANNFAIFGLAGNPPAQILSGPIEHPCVVEPLRRLAARGFDVQWLPQSAAPLLPGFSAPLLADCAAPRLACLTLVDHETGAIQPVQEFVSKLPKTTFVHCDAAQAVGKIPVHFHNLGVTTLAVSGHKFGAPKGVGLLLLRRGVQLSPLMWGGHQQQGRRPGTENPALAAALAAALEFYRERMPFAYEYVRDLRQRFIDLLCAKAQPVVVNGHPHRSLASPYVANVSFPGCRAELLLMKLDLADVACSTGSACSSGSLLPSPVLQAMGVPDDVLRSAMRFSFFAGSTKPDIEEAARRIIKAVKELRAAGS